MPGGSTGKPTILRVAIEKHLGNPDNGLYYLNIDVDGRAHSEVTADLVFPLIGGVSDEETTRLISERLNHPDFMTEAGLRTLSHFDPLLHPRIAWWGCKAACGQASPGGAPCPASTPIRTDGRGVAAQLLAVYPRTEALQHRARPVLRVVRWRGAAKTGDAPLSLGAAALPLGAARRAHWACIPITTDWRSSQRYLTTGNGVGCATFLTGGSRSRGSWRATAMACTSLTTDPVETPLIMERFDEDVSDLVIPEGGNISVAAFAGSGRIILCLGSTSAAKQPHLIALRALLENVRRYEVTLYSSEVDRWTRLGSYLGGALERLSIDVEGGGFALPPPRSPVELGGSLHAASARNVPPSLSPVERDGRPFVAKIQRSPSVFIVTRRYGTGVRPRKRHRVSPSCLSARTRMVGNNPPWRWPWLRAGSSSAVTSAPSGVSTSMRSALFSPRARKAPSPRAPPAAPGETGAPTCAAGQSRSHRRRSSTSGFKKKMWRT